MLSYWEIPKDPARRHLWLSRVPHTKIHGDCEIHFKGEDIMKESTEKNGRRKRKKKTDVLFAKRNTESDVPGIWSNANAHLTNDALTRVTSCATKRGTKKN